MVHWNVVLSTKTNNRAVVDFVEGSLNIKDFKQKIDVTARKEFAKIAVKGADTCRRLARKALRRRSIRYTLNG